MTCSVLIVGVWLSLLVFTAFSSTDQDTKQHGNVVNLDSSNFNSIFLQLQKSSPCIVEFYASWCPACRHFMPVYAQVGIALSGIQDGIFAAALPSPSTVLDPAKGHVADSLHQYQHIKPSEGTEVEGAVKNAAAETQSAGGSITVARVDCAKEPVICGEFKVPSYPYVTVGTAELYLTRKSSSLHVYPTRSERSLPLVMKWIGTELNLSSTSIANGMKLALAATTPPPKSDLMSAGMAWKSQLVWTLLDVESATMTLYSTIMASPMLTQGKEKRLAVLQLVKLWAAAHPSAQCQAGAQRLAAFFTDWWPVSSDSEYTAPAAVKDYPICGKEKLSSFALNPGARWSSCTGSSEEYRGFTCGLWVMFHTCVERIPPDDPLSGDKIFMEGLRAFNTHFFQCQTYQEHFSQMLQAREAKSVRSKRDAVLWLWRVHNQVNARLMVEEAGSGGSTHGDLKHPKVIFPTASMCPKCYKKHPGNVEEKGVDAGMGNSTDWDEGEILLFLEREYGEDVNPKAENEHTGHGSDHHLDSDKRAAGQGSADSAAHRKFFFGSSKPQQLQQLSESWPYVELTTCLAIGGCGTTIVYLLILRGCFSGAGSSHGHSSGSIIHNSVRLLNGGLGRRRSGGDAGGLKK
ncbi:hypothetical protein CEUSTIGMA_g6745.t1 [Chlamydomonas eustigma]|uniref:Sulfhydryl oxidase n=1 Tax=Chlamydomonas eustigma TaxID=1157962 RepID=A0A250X896_9CHLO|nr:hypothetical protein CEUSTIGMA_g6745.t1 [Chlamydomonas eustigma]|eukprot:GAX79304.1 hypothetical protein CEUSTIGMA_g6745.t1 [Chlamydomonas eustigma]